MPYACFHLRSLVGKFDFELIASFILKCLVKRKEARENALPQTVQEAK